MKKQRTFFTLVLTLVLSMILHPGNLSATPDIWMEQLETLPDYNLSGKTILMVVGHDYDHHEVYDMKEMWENWGAVVHVAAPGEKTAGHTIHFNGTWFDSELDCEIDSDVLLDQVDMTQYDALYFPGGKGPDYLVEKHPEVTHAIIDQALVKGIPVAAICGGPLVFTLHDHFKGIPLTASRSKEEQLRGFGADYIQEKIVVHENIITGNWPFFQSFAIAVAHKLVEPTATLAQIFPPSECPVLDILSNQSTTHEFAAEPLSEEKLQKIFRSGLSVPSISFRGQSWRFFVIESQDVRAQIKQKKIDYIAEHELHPQASEEQITTFWSQALDNPTLIVAMYIPNEDLAGHAHHEAMMHQHMLQAVLAAGTQMSVTASALDLGFRWLTALHPLAHEIKDILGADPNLEYVFTLAVGKPVAKSLPPVRKPLDQVVTWL